MTRSLPLAAALGLMLIAAGCAGQQGGNSPGGGSQGGDSPVVEAPKPNPADLNHVPDNYQGRFSVTVSVLENEHHGPQMCQAMAMSLPPQCGGPDVIGFKWDGLKYESAQSSKWGYFRLIGRFDGKSLTLTEPATDAKEGGDMMPAPDFTTPCPVPEGGWRPADMSRATSEAMNQVTEQFRPHPDFGELWIDEEIPKGMATPMNNPARLVLNVSFTKDLAAREAEIRKIWGGSLCVSKAPRTSAELQRIQTQVTEDGMSWSTPNAITGTVEVGVYAAYAKRQKELDAKYGAGLVILRGILKPID